MQEYLRTEYLTNKKSIRAIARELNKPTNVVNRLLRINGIISGKLNTHFKGQDLTGKKFNCLTVINEFKYEDSDTRGRTKRWLCKCDCGTIKNYMTSELTTGLRESCGCQDRRKRGFKEITGRFYCSIRQGARERGLEFIVNIEQLWELFIKQQRKCAISGVEIKFEPSRELMMEKTASLDRIDSSKGYILGNIQWIHKDINKMKNNMSESEFFNWIDIIHAHRNKTD